MFENDRDFIANKYHKQNEPFNAYNRMAYHGYDFDERTGKSDGEILDGLKKLDFDGLTHHEIKAKAVAYVLDNTRIDVNDRDFTSGFTASEGSPIRLRVRNGWTNCIRTSLNAKPKR